MSISLSLEVDVDEIVSSASKREKKQLLKALVEDMSNEDVMSVVSELKTDDANAINTYFSMPGGFSMSIMEDLFNRGLLTLSRSYLRVSVEDQAAIETIAKKY